MIFLLQLIVWTATKQSVREAGEKYWGIMIIRGLCMIIVAFMGWWIAMILTPLAWGWKAAIQNVQEMAKEVHDENKNDKTDE